MTLKNMRNKAGLTQVSLAELTGVSKRTIEHYESGYRNFDHARLETLCKVAKALNCTVADLLTDKELKKLYEEVK